MTAKRVTDYFEVLLDRAHDFSGVDNKMRISQENAFGRVHRVTPYDLIEDEIAIVNCIPGGLSGRVGWGAIGERVNDVARRLRAGSVRFRLSGSGMNSIPPIANAATGTDWSSLSSIRMIVWCQPGGKARVNIPPVVRGILASSRTQNRGSFLATEFRWMRRPAPSLSTADRKGPPTFRMPVCPAVACPASHCRSALCVGLFSDWFETV